MEVVYSDILNHLLSNGITEQMIGLRFFSVQQAGRLKAIHQLMNVAKYLNGDWIPDWKDSNQFKYSIYLDYFHPEHPGKGFIKIGCNSIYDLGCVYFKSEELAKRAIEILGEEKIREFCVMNAFKYRMRAGLKGGAKQDFAKETWYLNKAKELA